MSVRGFTETTRNDYIRDVRAFAAFVGWSPDTATAEDLRCFQHHQAQTGVRPPSINSAVAALRFAFTRDARPARPCAAAHGRARTAPVASRAECGGEGCAAAPGGAGAEVQGGLRRGRLAPFDFSQSEGAHLEGPYV